MRGLNARTARHWRSPVTAPASTAPHLPIDSCASPDTTDETHAPPSLLLEVTRSGSEFGSETRPPQRRRGLQTGGRLILAFTRSEKDPRAQLWCCDAWAAAS